MELKEARAWARRVGATIEEVAADAANAPSYFRIRLGVPVIGENGTRVYPEFTAPDAFNAANLAIIETAKAASSMLAAAKATYVESDFLIREAGS